MRYAGERKIMEEALYVEKERAQVTLNSIGDAVACTDTAGNLTFLNHVGEELTGWSWQEAAGRPMGDVFWILDGTNGEILPNPVDGAVRHDRAARASANSILVTPQGFVGAADPRTRGARAAGY